MRALSNEKIFRAYFQGIGTETEVKIIRKWKCENLRMRGNGCSNLMDHIKSAHPSFREELGIKSRGANKIHLLPMFQQRPGIFIAGCNG